MNRKIVGLGGVTVDQIGLVERTPAADEVVRMLEYRRQSGGMVGTALVAAARLGAGVEFVGGIGDDENGRYVVDGFCREGVGTSQAIVFEGENTAFSFVITLKGPGTRTIIHWPGVQSAEELGVEANLSDAGFLHLDGFWVSTAIRAAREARARGIVVTLDIGQNQSSPRIDRLLESADYLMPSLAFAKRYTGTPDVREAAERLLRFGPRAVILTLGEEGVYTLPSGAAGFLTPAFRVPVVDTTGAGDSFHGAFLAALSRGWDLEKALQFASAVAALKCTALGGQTGLPDFPTVVRFLAGRGIGL